MRQSICKRAFAALLLFLAALAPTHAEKVSTLPPPTGYIDDYADVLSAPSHAQLEALCRELHTKTKAQLFLVTIHTLDGASKEEFANQLFHTWKIGEKKTDRGVLILLAVDDHKYRIEVGYGLEGILNDAKVGDIGRQMVPALRAENYGGAASTSIEALARIIADDSHVTLDALQPPADGVAALSEQPPPPPPEPPPTPSNTPILLFIFGWIACVILGIGLFIRRQIQRGGIVRTGGSSSGIGFLDSGSSNSSSFSSDDSSSSSSDSFSGGDGGDSGGGGAGGDW
jgi:uncharacterized protein